MSITIRPVRPDDVPTLGRICFEAFGALQDRHSVERDFDSVATATMVVGMCAGRPDFAGFVAEDRGAVVGSNFLCFCDADGRAEGPMREGVAGVGPITILPGAQSRGVGRALMVAVMDEAARRGIERVRLLQEAINTASLSLYTKLGFDWREACALVRMAPAPRDDSRIATVSGADLPAIAELSTRFYGSSRANECAGFLKIGIPGFLLRRDGRAVGYMFPGFFGHAFAETAADLAALAGHAARHTPPMFQRFLLPLSQNDLHRRLMEAGCRSIKLFNYMTHGAYRAPTGAWFPAIGM